MRRFVIFLDDVIQLGKKRTCWCNASIFVTFLKNEEKTPVLTHGVGDGAARQFLLPTNAASVVTVSNARVDCWSGEKNLIMTFHFVMYLCNGQAFECRKKQREKNGRRKKRVRKKERSNCNDENAKEKERCMSARTTTRLLSLFFLFLSFLLDNDAIDEI